MRVPHIIYVYNVQSMVVAQGTSVALLTGVDCSCNDITSICVSTAWYVIIVSDVLQVFIVLCWRHYGTSVLLKAMTQLAF